jgi:hypothetical protein
MVSVAEPEPEVEQPAPQVVLRVPAVVVATTTTLDQPIEFESVTE